MTTAVTVRVLLRRASRNTRNTVLTILLYINEDEKKITAVFVILSFANQDVKEKKTSSPQTLDDNSSHPSPRPRPPGLIHRAIAFPMAFHQPSLTSTSNSVSLLLEPPSRVAPGARR